MALLCAFFQLSHAQTIPYKANLGITLSTGATLSPTGVKALFAKSPTSFTPSSDFSLQFSATLPSTGTLVLKASNEKAVGLETTLPTGELQAGTYTYRYVLSGSTVYTYRDGVLVDSKAAKTLSEVAYPSVYEATDGVNTGIYNPANLITNPGFESEDIVLTTNTDGSTAKFWPSNWEISGASAKASQSTGVRCNKGDATYANGREGSSALLFRQDGAGGFSAASGSYIYQKLANPLIPGRKYKLTFQVLSHTNALGYSYSVGVGSAKGNWNCLNESFTAPSTKQTLATFSYTFTASSAITDESYLAFICKGTNGIIHLDRITLVEATGDYNTLSLGLSDNTNTDITIGNVTYNEGAFTPEPIITNLIYADGEYRLYHPYYDMVLGEKADATSPGLSKLGTNSNADSYLFVAENSGTAGYYLLRQKSSGKYLTASTSNTYSVLLSSTRSTASNYLWSLTNGLNGHISNQYASTKYLGCDAKLAGSDYIGVFYDKALDSLSTWQILEGGFDFEQTRYQLHLTALAKAISEGDIISNDVAYSASSLRSVQTALTTAKALYEAASIDNLTEIDEATNNLLAAIETCKAANSTTWLSGTDFDVDNAFTLGLSGTALATGSPSASLIIRNAQGNGAVIKLSSTSITVGDVVISENITDANTPHNYQFAFNGSTVTVYKDNVNLGSAPSYAVPSMTSNGTIAEWSILGVSSLVSYMPEIVSASAAVPQGTVMTDKNGNTVRYAAFLESQSLTLNEPVDFHIIVEESPINNTKIDLANEKAWVIFDNTLPSKVVSSYLSSFTINGEKAVINKNVRVAIYLNGAVVIPHSSDIEAFSGYSGEMYAGEATKLKIGAHELGSTANSFQSFTLKRGYMATLATGSKGSGYSRVYVADHQDLSIPTLPDALNQRISSVNVKKWNYVSKKGWCSTNGSSSIATECQKMRATWFYTWSADRASTYDTEYVPIKGHLYWPSWSQINGSNSTHVLSINEPEHSEQHTSDKCSCGGVISEWAACTLTPSFQESGMRIGSPAPTDASWLTTYITNCNNMAYRCDFVVMHCYWGTNEAANATAWYNQLKTIYNNTKRPIWITEWNNGASWTTESWASSYGDKLTQNKAAIKAILNVLDTCSFVERYSIYNWDSYYRAMINDQGWVTPAGEVYRDNKSTFAYNASVQFTPVWWTPSAKEVTLNGKINSLTNQLVFTVSNENGDLTEKMILQRKKADGTYEDYYVENDRSRFDSTSLTYSFDIENFDLDNDEFRLYVRTASGSDLYSSTVTLGYLVNPNISTTSKTAVDGWTCTKSASNGFTKSTGDTFFEVWDATAIGMNFNYYQDVANLANGVYELSAACFNSTNGEANAVVNGHVGLYAQADGLEYFAPVTQDGELNLESRQTIPYIAVTNNTLRIGIKNIGAMAARWAGADAFKLRYLGTIDEVLTGGYNSFKEDVQAQSDARYEALFTWDELHTKADATGAIVNAACARQDTYGWTATTIDYSSGEAADGVSSNYYWNKWASSGYTSEMYQDFNFLPAGSYAFSALARCSAAINFNLYVSRDGGLTKEYTQNMLGTGSVAAANSEYAKGWVKVATPSVILRKGQSLRIGFTAENASGSSWWSTDNFALTYQKVDFTNLNTLGEEESTLQIVSGKGELVLTSRISTHVNLYNATGTFLKNQKIDAGSTSIALPAGVYFVENQKVIVR